MTGIYCIENQKNGKKYVGQAVNIEKRWRQHRNKLINGTHYNEHLQRAWDQYGESNFSFYVLEICDEQSLDAREIHYIETLGSFESGKKRSKEQKEKISKPVICIETDEIFVSITEAAKKHDVTIGAISRALRGKSKTCCGLHWSYYER